MDQDGEIMKRRHLSSLLSIKNRFHLQWNLIETVEPINVSSFKSVSPSLKPLIDREINTYIEKFQSFMSPPLDAVSLAAGQTLYRLMNNRLGTLQMMWSINPGSEGLTDHSTRWLMLHHSRTCPSHRDSSGDMAFESDP